MGITLPQFRHDTDPARHVARRAEAAGLDGVFAFNHLWPLGRPDRPALDPLALLASLAVDTGRLTLGTLVSRVGLVPDAVLVNGLLSLWRVAGGRFVAGLGTGDRANRDENLAAGIPFPPARERTARMSGCAGDLRAAGVPVWVGGRSALVRSVAAAHADGWNAWGASPDEVEADAGDLLSQPARARGFEVSWGGQVLVAGSAEGAAAKLSRHGTRPGLVHGTTAVVSEHIAALARRGVAWAIYAPLDLGADPGVVDLVAEAAAMARELVQETAPP